LICVEKWNARLSTSTRSIVQIGRGLKVRFLRAGRKILPKPLHRWGLYTLRVTEDRKFEKFEILFEQEKEVRASNNSRLSADGAGSLDVYPSLGFRDMGRAMVSANPRVTTVLKDGVFWLPQAVDQGPWRVAGFSPTTGGITYQLGSEVLATPSLSPGSIPAGIFIGTWSPHNWYHWIIDILPSVFLARQLPNAFRDYPLLIPELALKNPAWLEPLELVRHGREIVPLPPEKYVRVEHLIWVDSPTSPGPLPINRTRNGNFRIHGTAMRAYRDHIVSALRLPGGPPTRKLFLARRQNGNRPYNQDELLRVAGTFGYEPVYLDTLNFRESVKVMSEALCVVGPHGAGWANALFCSPSTRVFLWTWAEAKQDNWFANICSVGGLDYRVALSAQLNEDKSRVHFAKEDFILALQDLEASIG
jgi:capsular polysaccharide biosynthesis protein